MRGRPRKGTRKLITGQIATSQLADYVRKDLDSVIFYGGRNG